MRRAFPHALAAAALLAAGCSTFMPTPRAPRLATVQVLRFDARHAVAAVRADRDALLFVLLQGADLAPLGPYLTARGLDRALAVVFLAPPRRPVPWPEGLSARRVLGPAGLGELLTGDAPSVESLAPASTKRGPTTLGPFHLRPLALDGGGSGLLVDASGARLLFLPPGRVPSGALEPKPTLAALLDPSAATSDANPALAVVTAVEESAVPEFDGPVFPLAPGERILFRVEGGHPRRIALLDVEPP